MQGVEDNIALGPTGKEKWRVKIERNHLRALSFRNFPRRKL